MGAVRMNPERWQRIAAICDAALDVADSERDTFLADACAGDATLRQEVQALLAQDHEMSPLDQPVWVADDLLGQPATLAIGETIGIYRIEGILGAGGMGQVYRAKDTKLGRSVALKVLPDVLARDPERRARFQREAQVLAALNHPHIGAIHGFEDSGRIHALVLELVDGPTLADMLAPDVGSAPQGEGRRLPLDEDASRTVSVVFPASFGPASMTTRPRCSSAAAWSCSADPSASAWAVASSRTTRITAARERGAGSSRTTCTASRSRR